MWSPSDSSKSLGFSNGVMKVLREKILSWLFVWLVVFSCFQFRLEILQKCSVLWHFITGALCLDLQTKTISEKQIYLSFLNVKFQELCKDQTISFWFGLRLSEIIFVSIKDQNFIGIRHLWDRWVIGRVCLSVFSCLFASLEIYLMCLKKQNSATKKC